MTYWKLFTNRGQAQWRPVSPTEPDAVDISKLKFDSKNPNSQDAVWRKQRESHYQPFDFKKNEKDIPVATNDHDQRVLTCAIKGVNFFQTLQADNDGHWPGEYGGPMFLLPGAIITMYITGTLDEILGDERKHECIRYLRNHQRSEAEGGGWGIDIERHSTQFGTVLNYVTLRLLGVSPNEPYMKRALTFIHEQGGAVSTPSWGKFWLACLGCFDWRGYNSVLPELWLTPYMYNPIHPGRWWCHCRMVYLPMAYCYGARVVGQITPLVEALRHELYIEDYKSIAWENQRDNCCPLDLYYPQTKILKVLNFLSNTYERIRIPQLRDMAQKYMIDYIHNEDEQTKYVDIGPVNKYINMLSVWHYDGPLSERFARHKERALDYFWLAEDGMKCQGYNGSQLWDTSFTAQSIAESGLAHLFPESLRKMYHYIDISQVREDVQNIDTTYRHISNGGWPFSTNDHGWPITDCTAEGVKASILLNHILYQKNPSGNVAAPINAQRLYDAINVILSFQNGDGSWSTYELNRSYPWLEYINPAELFGGIMIDYGYVECTSACVTALCAFRRQKEYSQHRRNEVDKAIEDGIKFIRSIQRKDGSWYGSWAVCFTYGTWFGVEALVEAGYGRDDPSVKKAVQWLLDRQLADGGWGESYKSCVEKRYVQHPDGSQVVNTAWACLTLMKANYADQDVVRRGVELIVSRQLENGDWRQEGISGVFNNNCMITYINYRCIFTIWALGRYLHYRGVVTDSQAEAEAETGKKNEIEQINGVHQNGTHTNGMRENGAH